MSTRGDASFSTDAAFFLACFHHVKDGKPDWNAVANECNISHARNCSAKFNSLAQKYGYKWEQGKCNKIEAVVAPASKPAKAKKATTAKASKKTPAGLGANDGHDASPAKKRKIIPEEDEDSNVEEESDMED